MRELHLFAGAGGGILGGMLLGHTCVCAVEIEPYFRRVLLQRQRDGILPRFPIWDDVRTFDGKPWRSIVDVVCGGFPCQDISVAGKGAGIEGERSGLWSEMRRIISEIRPKLAFVENSPMLTIRGLGRVHGEMAELGYCARHGVVSAADAIWSSGNPVFDHLRERLFIKATNSNCLRELQSQRGICYERRRTGDGCETTFNPNKIGLSKSKPKSMQEWAVSRTNVSTCTAGTGWWSTEPGVGRMAYGVANRVDRLKAIGNGQVPAVVRLAWTILSQDL